MAAPLTLLARSSSLHGVETFQSFERHAEGLEGGEGLVSVEGMDLSIGIHPAIREFLFEANWQGAREVASARHAEFSSSGYQLDGLRVRAGPSWQNRLERPLSMTPS